VGDWGRGVENFRQANIEVFPKPAKPEPNKKSFFASRLPHDYRDIYLKSCVIVKLKIVLNQEVAGYFAQSV
jgi:hypothetical protein